MSGRPSSRDIAVAAVVDGVCVVVFVALGRRSHGESGNVVAGTAKVAAPFLVGLVTGWLAARAWRAPRTLETALVVWPATVAVGMVLRHWAFHRGTPVSFIIVASCFTGLFLVGWRVVTTWWLARRTARSCTSA